MSLSSLILQIYNADVSLEKFCKLNESSYVITITKVEYKTALDDFSENLKKENTRKALSIIRALLLISRDKTIKEIRREGYLRCSRYQYRERTVKVIADDILQNAIIYGLIESQVDYFQSMSNLLSLASNLRHERANIVKRLREKKDVVIKTLLAYIEFCFKTEMSNSKLVNTESLNAYSSEEMAESFSYIFGLFQTTFGFNEKNLGMVDDSKIEGFFYQKLLIDAAKICKFHEAEILLDAFPYKAILEENIIKFEAINPFLEKSIRIGYIQTTMQKSLREMILHQEYLKSPNSVIKLARDCFNSFGESLINLEEKPIPRYVMRLPIDHQLLKPFCEDNLFLEDLSNLEALGTEDYISQNEVVSLPIVGNITVFDIIKVQRFILFIHVLFYEKIQNPLNIDEAKIALRSCILVFKRDVLLQILNQFVSFVKAEEILELLTYDSASSNFIDLQYTPIIKIKEWYMFSPLVLGGSNLVRNILRHNKLSNKEKRLTLRDGTDPMLDALANALKNAGFLVATGIKLKKSGNELETDILAYYDGYLFIFECKNAFHPCNVYELRTSYQYITDAAEQLEKRKLWLIDKSKQQILFKSLDWNVLPTSEVITCIATGNRVFNGYECEAHPVKHVHELLNVLKSGRIELNNEEYRIWNNATFSVDDLLTHITGKNITADFLESLDSIPLSFKFGSKFLSFSTYVLDFEQLSEIMKSRYPVVETSIEVNNSQDE